jgi:hypothetical protein
MLECRLERGGGVQSKLGICHLSGLNKINKGKVPNKNNTNLNYFLNY